MKDNNINNILTPEEVAWVKEQYKTYSLIPKPPGNGIKWWECQSCGEFGHSEKNRDNHVCTR